MCGLDEFLGGAITGKPVFGLPKLMSVDYRFERPISSQVWLVPTQLIYDIVGSSCQTT